MLSYIFPLRDSEYLDTHRYIVVCTGIAYTIDPLYESEVRDYLGTLSIDSFHPSDPRINTFIISDYREKDGYTLEEIDIYGVQDGKEVIVHHKVRSACRLFKYV